MGLMSLAQNFLVFICFAASFLFSIQRTSLDPFSDRLVDKKLSESCAFLFLLNDRTYSTDHAFGD